MGMFDTVKYECDCPKCGELVYGFQSKDGDCVLDLIKPTEVDHFYSHCGSCDLWIDFVRVDKHNFKRSVRGRGRKDRKSYPEYEEVVEFRDDPEDAIAEAITILETLIDNTKKLIKKLKNA